MGQTLSVTAVIPTLSNTQGLKHLLDELEFANIPVVVINNGQSSKNQIPRIKHNKSKIISPDKNLGFARAVNLGVKQAQSDWVWILNDDIEGVNSQLVNQLISKAQKKHWDAISPVLIKPEGTKENIGYMILPIGKAHLNFDEAKYSDQDLDGLTAAALLIKRGVFNKLQGFDESFFAYLEDVDLFLRMKEMGYHFGAYTNSKVIHHHQTTSKKMNKGFKPRLDMINWWRIIFKHPQKFIYQPSVLAMLLERGRNLSGYLKAVI